MRPRTAFLLTPVFGLTAATAGFAADPQGPRGPLYAGAVAPMNRTVETRLLPQTAVLLEKLLAIHAAAE